MCYVYLDLKSELNITGEKLRVGKNATEEVIDSKLKVLEDECVLLLESFNLNCESLIDITIVYSGYVDLRRDMLRYNISKYIAESGNLTLRNDKANKIYGLSLYEKFFSRLSLLQNILLSNEVDEDGNSVIGDKIFGIALSDNSTLLGLGKGFRRGWY